MPRTPAAYVSRLNAALKACAELAASEGFVTAQRLAEALGVTERMARIYLVDLLELGALEYAGGGRYRLSAGSAGLLERWEAVGEELSVEGVVLGDPRREAVSYMLEKVYRIREVVAGLGRREELRRKLLSLPPPEGFAGDKLVSSSKDLEPGRVAFVAGEAAGAKLANYVLAKYVPITVAYVSSVAALARLADYGQAEAVEYLRRPSVREFRGEEPFDGGPYELRVEYPELLAAGRRIAARLLAARLRLLNAAEALERGMELVVAGGTMLPHGFVVPGSSELRRMAGELAELHGKVVGLAAERGAALASFVTDPRDYRFYEAVRGWLGLRVRRVNDAAFLAAVLEPWEYTAPMRVERERGREVEGWYEFYWKVGERVVKVEYVARGDPLEEQERLLSLLAPNMHVDGRPVGVTEATIELDRHLRWIKRTFELALRAASRWEGG
jgi:hypothetical protein